MCARSTDEKWRGLRDRQDDIAPCDYKKHGLNGVRVQNQFLAAAPVDVRASRDGHSFDALALRHCYDKVFVERGMAKWSEPEPEGDLAPNTPVAGGTKSARAPYVPVPGVSGLLAIREQANIAREASTNHDDTMPALLPAAPVFPSSISTPDVVIGEFYPAQQISMSTDGASVNLGKFSGLCKLFEDRNPHMLTIHAVAHVIELAVHDAIDGIEAAESVFATNQACTVEYNTSAKKLLSVREVADRLDVKKLSKLQSRHGIRWQESTHRGLRGIIDNWAVLCTDLYQRASAKAGMHLTLLTSPEMFLNHRVKMEFDCGEGVLRKYTGRVKKHVDTLENGEPIFEVFFSHSKDHMTMGRSEIVAALQRQDAALREQFVSTKQGDLYEKLTKYLHVQLTYFFADVTSTLKQISKVFQGDSLHFQKLKRTLVRRLGELEALKTTPAAHGRAFISDFDHETEIMHKIELQDVAAGQAKFPEIREETIEALSDRMKERFDPLLEHEILSATCVFDHSEWPRDGDALNSFGNEQVEKLLKHFEKPLLACDVDIERAAVDWIRMKTHIMSSSLRTLKYDDMYEALFDHRSSPRDDDDFFDILMLVLCVHCIALDTSICERLFSLMNRLQTKVRNIMGILLLQMSMTICTLGKEWQHDSSKIPIDDILKVWRENKKKGRYEDKALWSIESLIAHEAIVEASIFDMQQDGFVTVEAVPVEHMI